MTPQVVRYGWFSATSVYELATNAEQNLYGLTVVIYCGNGIAALAPGRSALVPTLEAAKRAIAGNSREWYVVQPAGGRQYSEFMADNRARAKDNRKAILELEQEEACFRDGLLRRTA